MKIFIPFVLVACIYLPASVSGGFAGKSLIFPSKTTANYVELKPTHFPNLNALTLCMRAASEEQRGYGLFSYATTQHHNELLLWYSAGGEMSLYFRDIFATFSLPEMNVLLRHICVTWQSSDGLLTFWVNGERSEQKVVNRGGSVLTGGAVILGQEQDSVRGKFDADQSFVGEITDVNLWDHVLTASEIKTVSQDCHSPGGNIIDWATITYRTAGNAMIKDNQDCPV